MMITLRSFKTMAASAAVVSLSLVAQAADKMVLGVGMNGDVTIGDTGARLQMLIHHKGWAGTSSGMSPHFSFPDPVTKTATVEFIMDNEKCADGRISVFGTDDARAVVSATLTATRTIATEQTPMSLQIPYAVYGGGKWKCSNGSTGTFKKVFEGASPLLNFSKIQWVDFTAENGKYFRLTFPTPVQVYMQDNRRWGTDTATLRIIPVGGQTFNQGEMRTFFFIVSTEGEVSVNVQKPVVIKAGDEWTALDYLKDIEPGSAIDFSNQGLQDAPAGKYGWTKNVNGHFEFENLPGKKQRFYGVNLCFEATAPDHKTADMIVTRLVRLGYNSVRIHHYESVRGVIKGSNDGLSINAEVVERLDYLLAKCYEAGLYVTTDLYTCRPVKWRAIGIDRDGEIKKQIYKNLIPIYEPAFQNWATFTRNILTHVNPYTGRAYKDEPGLAFISLVNENHLGWCWADIRKEEILKKSWRAWLAEKRVKDPSFGKGADDPEQVSGQQNAVFAQYMADMERAGMTRMTAFLKELGVKALLTNQNCGVHFAPLMVVRDDLYDYVDDHFYVDHPHFLGKSWSLPSRCDNRNPVFSSWLPPVAAAYTRIPNKPFTITEWNFSGPGMYRGVGGIMTGAISALQDWDALWRFAYSHGLESLPSGKGTPGYFDTVSDPLGQACDRASICLFLRGDLAPLEDMVLNRVTPEALMPKDNASVEVVPYWRNAAWQIKTGTTIGAVEGVKTFPLTEHRKKNEAPVPLKANPAIGLDRDRGSFTINTPKTSGAFVPKGAIDAGAVSFVASDTPTTVWASSLDGQPIAKSTRLLVTHLTDVQADGNVYAEPERQTILKWGWKRSVVRNGTAKIAITVDPSRAYTVYALASNGKRLETMPSEMKDGKLRFTADVKGPNGARMLYEVAAK